MQRVVLLSLIWGWSFPLIKVALGGMTPATVAFARIALGMVVTLVVLRVRPRRKPSLAVLAALVLLAGCGGGSGSGGSGADARCGDDTQEALDPGSLTHLLPGAPEPAYSSDPPTSGPHLAGAAPQGAQDEPVPRPAQVALLEAGGVMLQFRDITPADLRRLRTLSERQVVVAPNPDLDSPVVATAWRHRLACGGASGPALDDLESFVDTHKGNGPE